MTYQENMTTRLPIANERKGACLKRICKIRERETTSRIRVRNCDAAVAALTELPRSLKIGQCMMSGPIPK
jgi:hypothetical protein